MKNRLAIIFLIFITSLNAQSKEGQVGIKAGLNFSTFSGAIEADLSMRFSFNIGLMVETELSNHIAFQPEVLFSSQGSNEMLGSTDYEYRLNYLNLPLLMKFYLSEGFSFDVGPQLGVLISARESNTSTNDSDIKTSFKETDYGLVFGVSRKFDKGLNVSARYNLGLQNIRNTSYSNLNYDKLNNSVFQLSLGYYFNKKKK